MTVLAPVTRTNTSAIRYDTQSYDYVLASNYDAMRAAFEEQINRLTQANKVLSQANRSLRGSCEALGRDLAMTKRERNKHWRALGKAQEQAANDAHDIERLRNALTNGERK